MSRKWVSDASPLILLAKVEHLWLLPALADELLIPRAVAREVEARPEGDPARQWLEAHETRFISEEEPVVPEVAAWDLGHGEAATISWARQRAGWTVLLDDAGARQAARALAVTTIGTLGIVLVAKTDERIERVQPLIDRLADVGMRLSENVVKRVLHLAGEEA